MGCLAMLKHLDLENCFNLDIIPCESISRLSRLKVLALRGCYGHWEVTERRGWFSLIEIEGLKCLSHLEICLDSVHALEMFLDSHKLLKLTRVLSVGFCKGLKTSTKLSSTFRTMRSLRCPEIKRCIEMEELMIDSDVEKEDDHSFSSLESLTLWGLHNLNIIRVGGCIQNLHKITIRGCDKLKSVTWILQLQNLEEIDIGNCRGLDEVISTSGMGEACLRCFKNLFLYNLPELTSICNHTLAFPSLEKLEVCYCPKLKKLPLCLQSADNPLKEILGQKEWWDGLEWEEDGIKSNLFPLFKETMRWCI